VIPSERAHLRVAAISHPGMSGKNNEDRYGVSAFRLNSGASRSSVLAVVADGIGGHRAGEIAAELAVEIISRVIAESDASQPVQTLQDAIVRASQVIHDKAEANPSQRGMGSTCASAWVIGDRLYTASVGDSRIYLIRGGTIRQLTTDHTWVQEAIESGALSPQQARDHPNAHVIRRYLGSRQSVVPDFRLHLRAGENDMHAESNQGTRLFAGDCLVLCSDGLTDLVDDSEIFNELKTKPVDDALNRLVDLANQRGGHDNITIVTLSIPSSSQFSALGASPKPRSRLVPACMMTAVLFAVVVSLVGGAYWYLNHPIDEPTPLPTSTLALEATLFPEATQIELPPGVVPGSPATTPPSSLKDTAELTQTPLTNPGQGKSPTAMPELINTLTPWPTNTRTSP
jgi:serine/threonine protein phosphatase PrpC